MSKSDFQLIRVSDFAGDVVKRILQSAEEAIAARGEFRLSLCGGGTPKPIYEALAKVGDQVDWSKWFITFGDERTVGPENAQSNYRMVREAWLEPANVPAESVLRLEGELAPAEAANKAEAVLRKRAEQSGETIFRHDLTLLGMGGDGHTASLFPGTAALQEKERWVMENVVPQLETTRITFTYPLLNASRNIYFLVKDPTKEPLVDQILNDNADYPARDIAPTNGSLTWLLG